MLIRRGMYVVGIVVLLVLTCLSGCMEQEAEDEDKEISFLTYENEEKGLSIEYPENWTKQEHPPQVPTVLVLFTSPYDEPYNASTLMIGVITNDSFSRGMEWFAQAHIENLTTLVDNFTLISNRTTTLSGRSAYRINFTFTQHALQWSQMETWTIKGNTLYQLIYQVQTSRYSLYSDLIGQMIESFTLTDITSEENGEQEQTSNFTGGTDIDNLVGT